VNTSLVTLKYTWELSLIIGYTEVYLGISQNHHYRWQYIKISRLNFVFMFRDLTNTRHYVMDTNCSL